MNKAAKEIVLNRMNKDGRNRMDYADYNTDRRMDYEMDGRRGVKGTGRYGMGGSRYYADREGYDRRDYADEPYSNREKRMKEPYDWVRDDELYDRENDMASDRIALKKAEIKKWKEDVGEKFSKDHIIQTAEKLGIKYNNYDENDLCLMVNVLYSDFSDATKGEIYPEKELAFYVKLAKAWLEDKDSNSIGKEKIAMYYYVFVDKDEDGNYEDEEDFRRRRR
jgi:hypothetical protein